MQTGLLKLQTLLVLQNEIPKKSNTYIKPNCICL